MRNSAGLFSVSGNLFQVTEVISFWKNHRVCFRSESSLSHKAEADPCIH